MSSTPSITDVYPAPGSTGIAIGDQVRATFNQEMDETSINEGTFILVGPDRGITFRDEINPWDQPGFDDEDILSSPYFKGYVKGTITFSRVDIYGAAVDDDETDYTGAGNLWYTVAHFTPDKPLSPNKQYRVYILGDENTSDAFDSGVRSRTVFDTQETKTGTGTLTFGGGYTGNNVRNYTLKITTGGVAGTAEYEWWDDSDPLTVYTGITSTGRRELEDGIWVECDPDGTFAVDDIFQIKVVSFVAMPQNYTWTFMTGSGSIVTPPSQYSTSGIQMLGTDFTSASLEYLTVVETDPENGEYGVQYEAEAGGTSGVYQSSDYPIVATITFATTLNASSFVGNLEVWSEPCNGDTQFTATGDLDYAATVSGSVLTITIESGQVFANNIVVVKIDKDVEDTDGHSLVEDYSFYFATTYTPAYSTLRRIRLDIGPFITNVIDETIMLAVFEASLAADVNRFSTTTPNGSFFVFARREYATCLAELTLLRALLGDSSTSDRLSKTLGDLSVMRGGQLSALRDRLAQVEDCAARWQVAVQTGGEVPPDASLIPDYAVKGGTAEDSIVFNRQWESMSGIGESSRSAANDKDRWSTRRYLRTFRKRTS